MTERTVDWKHELLDQMDFYHAGYLMPRLEGLTNDEYFWQPVANCWTVNELADGTFSVDQPSYPDPVPAPFTTIAWRMTHLSSIFGTRYSRQFGDGTFSRETMWIPGTAAEAIDELVKRKNEWRDGLEALTEEEFGRPTGPTEGPFENAPLATLILHVQREFMHHGGEICLLRDLYRYRDGLKS